MLKYNRLNNLSYNIVKIRNSNKIKYYTHLVTHNNIIHNKYS
jgi:hypothetical protein